MSGSDGPYRSLCGTLCLVVFCCQPEVSVRHLLVILPTFLISAPNNKVSLAYSHNLLSTAETSSGGNICECCSVSTGLNFNMYVSCIIAITDSAVKF